MIFACSRNSVINYFNELSDWLVENSSLVVNIKRERVYYSC